MAIWSSPSTIWNGTASAQVLDGRPRLARRGSRGGSGGTRAGCGARPRTPPRRRSGRRPRRSGPAPARAISSARATGTTGVAARMRPTRALLPIERSRIHPTPSSARPARTRTKGSHAGDDSGRRAGARRRHRAGKSIARRNLLDAWALMSSPPLASLGPFGLTSTLRDGRDGGQRGYPPARVGRPEVVHRASTRGRVHGTAGPRRASAGAAAGPGIQRSDLAVEARQHQPAADELDRRRRRRSARRARRPRRRPRSRTSRPRPGR